VEQWDGPAAGGAADEAGIGFAEERQAHSTALLLAATDAQRDLWPWRGIGDVAAVIVSGLRVVADPP